MFLAITGQFLALAFSFRYVTPPGKRFLKVITLFGLLTEAFVISITLVQLVTKEIENLFVHFRDTEVNIDRAVNPA